MLNKNFAVITLVRVSSNCEVNVSCGNLIVSKESSRIVVTLVYLKRHNYAAVSLTEIV